MKQFNLQTGVLSSALEHATPEQMFNSDPNNPPDAISAVKALQKASEAGQKIYHITLDNMNQTLGNIHHDIDTMNEIRASLNVGKTVITHTHSVSVPGWSGAGYVILDSETNVGAWKIAGGANGAFLGFLAAFVITVIALVIAVSVLLSGSVLGLIGGALLLLWEAINIKGWVDAMNAADW